MQSGYKQVIAFTEQIVLTHKEMLEHRITAGPVTVFSLQSLMKLVCLYTVQKSLLNEGLPMSVSGCEQVKRPEYLL